jgi:signal transduction histidine kinase
MTSADARAAYGKTIDVQLRQEMTALVSLRLMDGGWLNFSVPVDPAGHFWSMRFWLSMAVMILAVVIFAAIVVHHLIKPLRLFVRAANRLGVDVDAPALPETGPREVREATRAFNDMQRRIRRMIDSRTHMLAAISHDLRTPITLLRLRAEFIEDEDERDKTMTTLDEMESMIAATLAFARQDAETEESRRVDLSALIDSICHDMDEVGHSIDFDPPETLTYECRPTALRRALNNVVENAVKYGGEARVRLVENRNTVQVLIEDSGPGIPVDELDNVFEPFYRVDRSRNPVTGGVGLGLSVARTVAHAHGGEVRLSNRPEGGLRVSVELPR